MRIHYLDRHENDNAQQNLIKQEIRLYIYNIPFVGTSYYLMYRSGWKGAYTCNYLYATAAGVASTTTSSTTTTPHNQ